MREREIIRLSVHLCRVVVREYDCRRFGFRKQNLFLLHLWFDHYKHQAEWPYLYILLVFVQIFFLWTQGIRMPREGRVNRSGPPARGYAIGWTAATRRGGAGAAPRSSADCGRRTHSQPGSLVGGRSYEPPEGYRSQRRHYRICSLHQVAYARSYADRIIDLSHGSLLMDKPATAFLDQDADALYAPQSSQQIAAAPLGR
jgi:hypothetical protein